MLTFFFLSFRSKPPGLETVHASSQDKTGQDHWARLDKITGQDWTRSQDKNSLAGANLRMRKFTGFKIPGVSEGSRGSREAGKQRKRRKRRRAGGILTSFFSFLLDPGRHETETGLTQILAARGIRRG